MLVSETPLVGAYNGGQGRQAEGKGDTQVLGLSSGDGLQSSGVCMSPLYGISLHLLKRQIG